MADAFSPSQRRWMRPNAHLYIRQDAYKFMPPTAPRLCGAEVVRYFWPNARADGSLHAYESKYDPNQPRVPAGDPDGGQWTDANRVSSSGDTVELSAAKRKSAAYCWNQMLIDMMYCSALYPPWRAAACRSQANERYAACLAEKPRPPLPF